MQYSTFIDLGGGVTLARSTPSEITHVNENLRAGDRAETEVFDSGRPDRLSDMDRCWTIRDGNNIVGFIGTSLFPNEGTMSTRRFLVELTTKYVDTVKLKYVRYSRRVLSAVIGATDPWVSDFFTLPMKSYEGAVKWDERILRMHRVREIEWRGIPHVLFHITRQEGTL